MGLLVALVVIVALLWVWGHGPRKTTAEAIVLAEDVKDQTVRVAKATPAKVAEAKVKAEQLTAQAVVTTAAVTKVAADRGSKIAKVAVTKGGEVIDETNHYFKGFCSDVGRMRRQIKAERKRLARAEKVAKEAHLKAVG